MEYFKEEKIIEKPVEEIYNLIANVESYPNFIPFITKVDLLKSYDNIKEYELSVGFKIFKEKFSTKDIFYKNKKIEIYLISGPFKNLYSQWTFEIISNTTTKVGFEINFEFKSSILARSFSKIFEISQRNIFLYFVSQLNQGK